MVRIFSNEYFELVQENEKVFIRTFQKGFPLKDFDKIIRMVARFKLTNFSNLKNALQDETQTLMEIGIWLPPMEIDISKDKMKAYLVVHDSEILKNEKEFLKNLNDLLEKNKIVYGIKNIDISSIVPGKAILIAEGTEPVKGEDAKVTYFKLPERKPVIREDGRANYFDMNFIFEVNENDWLGEKIPAKPGITGKNIYGEEIPAPPGKDKPLKYDRHSAYEVEEDGKIVIRALNKGVVEEKQGLLYINNHLPIYGDVGLETGNINFDGSITVRGTIQRGFSLVATGDISIEGLEGVTGAKLIESRNGDIYIKGGIFGLGETKVIAGGNIYVKHVNEASLRAKKNIVIGLYSLNSHLQADSILLDEGKGKIIGGTAVAKNRIVTAISGNRFERRTELIVQTVNRQESYKIMQQKAALLKSMQEEILKLTEKIEKFSALKERMTPVQLKRVKELQEVLEDKKQQMMQVEHEIQELIESLKSTGTGEIIVKKEAHPGTFIQIGNKSSLLTHLTKGRFMLEKGELNV